MMKGKIALLSILLLLTSFRVSAQDDNERPKENKLREFTIEEYIKLYSDIAQNEMRRLGIPASITLAQGILESNFGNSELSKNANNHFGIKCHDNWTGKGYLMDDDEARECFRVYTTAEDSYIDHSNFIKSRDRYAFLFELDPKDYKSWAKGLKNAGYATNPQYANLLIRIIEERKLDQFDTADPTTKEIKTPEDLVVQYNDKIFLFNNIKTVVVQPNQKLEDIAQQFHTDIRQLRKYNDLEEGDSLSLGTKIYLQPKRNVGFEKFHVVKKGETMKSISQKEGIKMTALYKKNRMEWGQEPVVGTQLCLKATCATAPELRPEEEVRKGIREEIDADQKAKRKIFEQQRADSIAAANLVTLDQPAPVNMDEEESSPLPPVLDSALFQKKPMVKPEGDPIYHTVLPKETLFSISKKYYTTVDKLQAWNAISPNGISISQQLIVGYGTIPVPPTVEIINPEYDSVNTTAFPEYHIVKAGESLFTIAKQYKITTTQIKEWNKLSGSELKAGQKLIVYNNQTTVAEEVPLEKEIENNKKDEAPVYHTVAPGETLYGIAKKYGVTVDDLKRWNDVSAGLKTGAKLVLTHVKSEAPKVSQDVARYYTIKAGDTLFSLARTYGVTVQQIKQWNKLTDNNVKLGQKLIIGY
jgi:LysM repeat protein